MMADPRLFEELGRSTRSCSCYRDPDLCVCEDGERGLRMFMDGCAPTPMTAEQREWCLREIDRGTEYGYERAAYETGEDRVLARAVIEVWVEYCRDKGLL
jgi:hypothetical protein